MIIHTTPSLLSRVYLDPERQILFESDSTSKPKFSAYHAAPALPYEDATRGLRFRAAEFMQ